METIPDLAIVLFTYQRTREALETIHSTCQNLGFPREKRKWYIGDDGSDHDHVRAITGLLDKLNERYWISIERLRGEGQKESYFCGRVWNLVLGNAHQFSDFVLQLEDDWNLDEPLNLIPYVKLLQERADVGAVSFRILSVETEVKTKGFNGEMFVEYLKTSQYAYSGNPILRHARFVKHYGWFSEEHDPGNIELQMDDKYRLDGNGGPMIWRPLSISPWGAWKHIGTSKTWT